MDIQTATQNAKKSSLLPVYVLAGEERLLITRCADAVRAAAVGSGPRGLSEDLFDGRQATAQSVMTACRTFPMMAKRRLVVVRGIDEMKSSEQEALIAYFAKPEPTAVLVLVGPKLDLRKKIALEAKKHDYLLVAKPPGEDELAPWIEHESRARNLTMEPGAIESLALAIGPDLSALSDAIERLALYTNGAPVTAATVDDVVTPIREIPAWDLADAIGTRNLASTLSILARLTAQRQAALPMLGLIARQVHMIAKARQHFDTKGQGSLASVLRVPPFAADKIGQQAKRWSQGHVQRALRVLASTDAALKGAKRDDARILEECAIALCGGAGMGELSIRAAP